MGASEKTCNNELSLQPLFRVGAHEGFAEERASVRINAAACDTIILRLPRVGETSLDAQYFLQVLRGKAHNWRWIQAQRLQDIRGCFRKVSLLDYLYCKRARRRPR
eukprot:TRINITY_DN25044_c0_g5_i3.p3 TRINITY_DN25044_c0_g5~~TRINITY_DN25044_c0_g5_i3.p3  ORF type:complete len:106 (-),score=11.23 TRINITY_DN25044_c0_g5_i3:318-635(-)